MKLRLAAIGMIVFLAVGSARAIVITNDINFDDQPGGLVPVTTQYQYEGVTFDAQTLSAADGSLTPYYPPNSYPIVVVPLDFTYVLASADGGVFTSAGAYVTGYGNTILDAYDAANNLVGSATVLGPNTFLSKGTPNQFESVSAPNIAYVTFSNSFSPYTFTVDDFTYTYTGTPPVVMQSSTPLPEPLLGTSLLLACLAGIRTLQAKRVQPIVA
jgi:hypothetical protein